MAVKLNADWDFSLHFLDRETAEPVSLTGGQFRASVRPAAGGAIVLTFGTADQSGVQGLISIVPGAETLPNGDIEVVDHLTFHVARETIRNIAAGFYRMDVLRLDGSAVLHYKPFEIEVQEGITTVPDRFLLVDATSNLLIAAGSYLRIA